MNERIPELWTRAEEELHRDFETGKLPLDIPRYWNDLMQEKFAELIVRECALTAGLMEVQGRKNIGAALLDRFEIKE
jgi:hypothetical protein